MWKRESIQGTDFKKQETTKREFHQEYYCFLLFGPIVREKPNFNPSYWSQLNQENKNILDEILVFKICSLYHLFSPKTHQDQSST